MSKRRSVKVVPGMMIRLADCTKCGPVRQFALVNGKWLCVYCSREERPKGDCKVDAEIEGDLW